MPISWRALRKLSRDSEVILSSLINISPAVGSSIRSSERIHVLLRSPLSPLLPRFSPFSMSNLTESSSLIESFFNVNTFFKFRMEIIFIPPLIGSTLVYRDPLTNKKVFLLKRTERLNFNLNVLLFIKAVALQDLAPFQ